MLGRGWGRVRKGGGGRVMREHIIGGGRVMKEGGERVMRGIV